VARKRVHERLPGVITDALITGKPGINFAPELAESTLVLARPTLPQQMRARRK
jgi:hypothetical protein